MKIAASLDRIRGHVFHGLAPPADDVMPTSKQARDEGALDSSERLAVGVRHE